MRTYHDLLPNDKEQLQKFPAYISLLAANNDGNMDEQEKRAAIKLTHIKTFSCDPMLTEFYSEVEKIFEKTIYELDNQLPHNKEERDRAIKIELDRLETILKKLGSSYAWALHRSLDSYKDHVSKAHRNVLEYFILPMPFEGLTD